MMYDLDNTAVDLLACNLPVLERGFLPVGRRHPSDPKDTCTLGMLRREVVKDDGRLSRHLLGLKGVFHQHENIHIVRFKLRSHKRLTIDTFNIRGYSISDIQYSKALAKFRERFVWKEL
jgi:hypothetical protein